MKKALGIVAALAAAAGIVSGCATSSPPSPPSSAPLKLGYLLPETGRLAFVGPPMISGVQFAVAEINAAGGVLGHEVELLRGDEADDPDRAREEASRLLSSGVHGIVGAAATGMTLSVIDDVTGAGVVQCSPSNTGIGLTTYPDGGYYFRTAPSDAVQAPVLADLVAEAGHTTVAIAARDDAYGVPFLEQVRRSLAAHGVTVVLEQVYDPEGGAFGSVSEAMVESGADAYVMLSFLEGAPIIQGLLDSGVEARHVFGADGIAGAAFADNFASPAVLEGMRVTVPTAFVPESFEARLLEFNPELVDFLFSPNAYDCVNVMALAATVAGSTASESMRDRMIAVTHGDNACTTFAECMAFVEAGESIAYQSAVGIPLNFMEVREGGGEPSRAWIETSTWENGAYRSTGLRVGDVLDVGD
ncbi:MAG: ABC transporter substrate-binding protein [Trueperaceae bacterium]|nr:ABC transporter substrate-binding protein [Trueperaceae bacterium]